MEDLIQNAHTLFNECPSQSPPVPSSKVEHRLGLVDEIPPSTQSSFSSLLSDASLECRLTLPPTGLLSPLLVPSSSKSLTKGVETTTQEKLIPPRATEALPNSTLLDVVPLPAPTSVAEWRLNQSLLAPDSDTLTIPQSPPEDVLSSTSDFPLSSVTSLQTSILGSP